MNSQITLKEGNVKTILNNNGDTLIVMHINDAKQILTDVFYCEISDSLVIYYEKKDKLNTDLIQTQKEMQVKLNNKIKNIESINSNLEKIITNKDNELDFQNEIIRQQRKEIRKQKLLKIGGFTGSIVFPIITALLLLR